MDRFGNLFVADSGNNRVMEMTPAASGFDTPVTILSGLSNPTGLTTDWYGNLFVTDTGNNRILMLPVETGGFASAVTVASGLSNPHGITVDSVYNLFVANTGSNTVLEIPYLAGTYTAPVVVGAGFNNPMSVAVDPSRSLYVADTGNREIVKEPFTSGGYSTQTVLWKNEFTPSNIYVDKSYDLFVADIGNNRIVENPWAASANRYNGQIILGNGYTSPLGVVSAPNGNVYVVDADLNQLLQVSTGSVAFGAVTTGSAGSQLTFNFNVAAGTTVGAVSILTSGVSGKDFVDAGNSSCLAQTYSAVTICSINVTFNPLGSGLHMGAIVFYDTLGNTLASAFTSGVGSEPQAAFIPGTATTLSAQLSGPSGVTVDGSGNVYIADTGNNRIVEIPWTGSGYGQQTTVFATGLNTPMGLAIDGAGNLYIASNGNDKVVKLPWTGSRFGAGVKVGTGMYGPYGVAVDAVGNLFVANTLAGQVVKFPWTGSAYLPEVEVGNYHKSPIGIAIDGNGTVYFSDPYQNQLAQVPWTGTKYSLQTNVPNFQTSFPSAIAVDGNTNLYILDTVENKVLLLPWQGTGFGQQITVAEGFNAPSGLAVDGNGNLYVADTGNNQVVKIQLSVPAPLSFAQTYVGSTSTDSAKITTIQNIGNEALSFSSITFPADFPESAGTANACAGNTTLDAGKSCELAIDFTPAAIGSPLGEAITVTDNSLENPASQQSFAVTGTSLPKVTQTISFAPIAGVTYGAAPIVLASTASSGLSVTLSVVSGPASLSHGNILTVTGAGVVTLEATQGGNSVYLPAAPVIVSVSVAPATLTVAPVNTTAVYGSIPATFHYAITGFVRNDSAGTAVAGQPVIACAASSASPAGTYTLTIARGTLTSSSYTFAFAPATLTVKQAILQIITGSPTHAYGSPMPAFSWKLSGFLNGDTAKVVTGSPVITTAANSGSPVGSYPILVSPGTLAAANYTFSGSPATLTVAPAILIVSANNQSIPYGSALPALSYSIVGFVNGDKQSSAVRGTPAMATTAAVNSGAGLYAITVSAGTLTAANYRFIFNAAVLSIQKAVLLVTPSSATSTYGAKLPAFSYTVTGFVHGDTASTALTGTPSLSTPANSASAPGTYLITASAGSLISKNYSFSFRTATLSIGKATLTVSAKPITTVYGAALPALSYSFSGFLNGDGIASISGAPSLTTSANKASPVGSYPVVMALGTLVSAKYSFVLVNTTLKVSPATLIVRASAASTIYGEALPAFTYTLSGFVNGDTAAVVSGIPVLKSSAAAAPSAGAYPIAVTQGNLSASNYTFVFVNATLTVNKALLTVRAANQETTYGAALPVLTYTLTGFVNGDSQAKATTGAPAISTAATSASSAGNYWINAAAGTLTSANYSFQFGPGVITVNSAPLTVTANSLSVAVGGVIPALTYTVSGFVNGDTQAAATTGSPALSTKATASSKAGTYSIAAGKGSMAARNYQMIFQNGTLTLTQ